MASLLESAIKDKIYAGFKGKLLTGSLRREAVSGGLDDYGDPVATTATTFSFEGIRETFDAAYRKRAQIPDTDVKVLIIAGSLSVTPKQGDKVLIRDVWHEVRRILAIDPANASYTLQAFEIDDPT